MVFWLALLPGFAMAESREGTVRSPRVEVRAGPSTTYYATSTLGQGERIEIIGQRYDYYEITPPPGSFSLVPAQSVTQTSAASGMVQSDTETIIGSTNHEAILICRGVKLPRGYLVQILDRTYVHSQGRSEAMFKILPPKGESRFIPIAAVEGSFGPAIAPVGYVIPREIMQDLPPDLSQALQQAEEAYKHGQQTGHWHDALDKYTNLSKSLHHSVKMLALNRLEFIKQQQTQPPRPLTGAGSSMPRREFAVSGAGLPPGSWQPQGTLPRSSLPPVASAAPSGRSGTTSSLTSMPPSPTDTTTPSTTSTQDRPSATAPSGAPPAAGSVPVVNRRGVAGYLRPGYRSDAGQPLYYLTNSSGMLITYVTPQIGVDLKPYLGRTVEVEGTPMIHRADLNGKHMSVRSIKPLAQ